MKRTTIMKALENATAITIKHQTMYLDDCCNGFCDFGFTTEERVQTVYDITAKFEDTSTWTFKGSIEEDVSDRHVVGFEPVGFTPVSEETNENFYPLLNTVIRTVSYVNS